MAENLLFPYAVEIEYSFDGLTHKKLLPCIANGTPSIGDLPSTIEFIQRDAGLITMDDAVDEYLTAMVDLYNATMFVGSATLWEYDDESNARTFITAYESAVNQGTITPTPVNQAARYEMLTYRTTNGGIFKEVFLETVDTFDGLANYASLDSDTQACADRMVSVNNWIVGRDNGYPFVFNLWYGGQNEALFKKRFR